MSGAAARNAAGTTILTGFGELGSGTGPAAVLEASTRWVPTPGSLPVSSRAGQAPFSRGLLRLEARATDPDASRDRPPKRPDQRSSSAIPGAWRTSSVLWIGAAEPAV